jgi:NADPH-dependent ferric siderophore reductase
MESTADAIVLPAAITRHLHVLAVTDVGPRIRRITVGGAELRDFEPLPGQDVVVHLVDEHGNGVRRRYTIRHLDPSALAFDLDVVVHGHGVGSTWGVEVRPGDRIEVFGPRGKVLLPRANWQLYVGDESGLPAIAEMIAALPEQAAIQALIEVQDGDDEQPISRAGTVATRWLHRGGAPAGQPDLLADALEQLRIPEVDRHVCVFAESRVVRRLRDELVGRGLRAEEISAKGYWNAGRARRD